MASSAAFGGGSNPGDCRALYYLVRRLKPQRILEIGTDLGCSTVSMALATARNRADGIAATLDTADIRNVNDPQTRPWLVFKSPHSPGENIATLGCGEFVRFEVGRSLDVLVDGHRRYGMIFLDGNHDAEVVYQEIPLALQRLEPPGLIMLHDYFPDLRPLWPGWVPITGPGRAIARLMAEGAGLRAVPLGDLPWPTKLGTRTTSLAALTRA
jgi:predicted O-methyltransferase YrrM